MIKTIEALHGLKITMPPFIEININKSGEFVDNLNLGIGLRVSAGTKCLLFKELHFFGEMLFYMIYMESMPNEVWRIPSGSIKVIDEKNAGT